MNLNELTLAQASEKLKNKDCSSTELTQACLETIENTDEKVQAFLAQDAEAALTQAKAVDAKIAQGASLPPLAGLPLALKDIFVTQELPTTCGSRMLEGYLSPFDATVVQKLKDTGYVLLGKLNMDEFAMGSSTETSYFQKTKNPWNLEHIPGGSSGGSAAAVAARQCLASLGTDTGGSIRQPASHCGIVGLKPSYGRVSRYGVVAFASSLDQVGPMTRDVHDAALLLNVIAGHDPLDSTSVPQAVPDYTQALKSEAKGLKIGIPQEYFAEGLSEEVRSALDQAIKTYQDLGAEIQEVSLPHTSYAVPTYYILAPAEASSNLARYDGVRYGYRTPEAKDLLTLYKKSRSEGFGAEVKRRIMLGTYVLSAGYYDAYYLKAQKVRTLIRQDFEKAFENVDVLLTPTAPTTAFKIGEKTSDPLQMYLSDIYTINVNLAGLPGMSLPCGHDGAGLPIGMQLIGGYFQEEKILHAAYAFEQATQWHQRSPQL